jgi:hypothetical protein
VTNQPPKPPALASRIASDAEAYAEASIDDEQLVARVTAALRESDHWNPVIAADELAEDAVDDIWYDENLAETYTRALENVHEDYLAQAMRVREAIQALEDDGREAWIARAISYRVASWVAWRALDEVGELQKLSADELCAACGAALETAERGS